MIRASQLALALLVFSGCDRVFGLNRIEPEPVGEDNGYTCDCTCTYPGGGVAQVALDVCMPPELNGNITDIDVTEAQLTADCDGRVESQIEEMADECYEGTDPVCDCVATPASSFFDKTCDAGCPEVSIDDTCSNWDPDNGTLDATCAEPVDCENYGPVCLKQGASGSNALGSGIMARTTTCDITDGELSVSAEDHSDTAGLSGVVHIAPVTGCAPDETCIGVDYRLEGTEGLHFDGFLGFGDTDITSISTSGATGAVALDVDDIGLIPQDGSFTSGRGFEDGSRRALTGTNADALAVGFDGDTCALDGSVVGGVGDPEGENAGLTASVTVVGDVVNAPPSADAGADQVVECTSADGATVTLDGTATTDREGVIAVYGWYHDDRAGPSTGLGATLDVDQALGTQTYVLKVVDGGMQASEDSVTVDVVDTTAPDLSCNAPATIDPPGAGYSFTATATDVCDDGLGAATVSSVSCFKFNGSGAEVPVPCLVSTSGPTISIHNTGGVGTHVRWTIGIGDAEGNDATATCEVEVVRR